MGDGVTKQWLQDQGHASATLKTGMMENQSLNEISALLPGQGGLGAGQATRWIFMPCISSAPKAGTFWNCFTLLSSSPDAMPPAAAQIWRVEWDEAEWVSQS